MSATSIIKDIRSSGGEIALADDGIKLKVPASLRDKAIIEIKGHKEAIRCALKDEIGDPWDNDDWCAFFDERAGIAEFDGRQTRAEAEVVALECCIFEWLTRNPHSSDAGRCAWCKELDQDGHNVVPFGTEEHRYTWLHSKCWNDWHQDRQKIARRALEHHGIKFMSALVPISSVLPPTTD